MIPVGTDPVPEESRVRPEDLVRGTVRLVVLPELFMRVDRMIDDPQCSGAALTALIGQDPALAARLLRIANSPFYGFPSGIHTLARAVTVIGRRGLRNLILAASASDLFGRLGAAMPDRDAFWRHSLCCGLTARLLGLRCGISEAEALFAAGLLHDIGKLVILDKLPEMGRQTQQRAHAGEAPLYLLENAVIGFDHADVGGELLRQWRLPEDLWLAVRDHHAPNRSDRSTLGAAIIHVADLLAHAFLTPAFHDADATLSAIDPPYRDLMALDVRTLGELHEEILFQFDNLSETMRAA